LDKYEYKLKTDQMKALASDGNYKEAADIADSINWRKVKNVNFLVKVGEVYEKVGRFEEARDVLLMAYDRSPIGRMIIYRLAELAIKMKSFEEAEEYYDEFIELAPNDNLKYVIRYKLSRAKGEPLADGIRILEALKDNEYSEEWAYELAYMYHRAGAAQKCVDACDELILWFGEGDYVERALELKMLYQPLTRSQEEKYRRYGRQIAGMSELYANDSNSITIPRVEVNNERYNTQNLQEEIAKSMQQIMDATERGTVSDTIENIKKMVEDIPYINIPEEENKEAIQEAIQEENEEIDQSVRNTFRELLAEEDDGQISLRVPEYAKVEQQITGQLRIDEILEEWEKTKRAAEAAIMESERLRLESEKNRALQEAGDIMERLADVIPQLNTGEDPAEVLRQQYLSEDNDAEAGKFMEDMNRMLQEQIDALSSEAYDREENSQIEEEEVELPTIDLSVLLENPEVTVSDALEIQNPVTPLPGEIVYTDEEISEDFVSEETIEETEPVMEDVPTEEAQTEDDIRKSIDEQIGVRPYVPVQFDEKEEFDLEDALLTQAIADVVSTDKTSADSTIVKTPVEKAKTEEEILESIPEVTIDEEEPASRMPVLTELPEEIRDIFSYFVPVAGMQQQLCSALTGAGNRVTAGRYTKGGNLVVQGTEGTGKTVLATGFIKALQKLTGNPAGKIGKIDADALNKKDIGVILSKVVGGSLIIEKAGDLSAETVAGMTHFLDADESGLLLILEDSRAGIEKIMSKSADFASRFTEKIIIPIFTVDELVLFGKAYAKEIEFEIDEMGVLALYRRISGIQRLDSPTTLTEVKDIIDSAVENYNGGGLRRAFSFLQKKSEDGLSVLREKDFEN